jgi:cyclopropane fatty-acyl-phospholipid synthase-like methyltransferase
MPHHEISLREDIYQTYHPFVLEQMSRNNAHMFDADSITLDKERAAFMFAQHSLSGKRVLDIGANQGYMTVEAALRGAKRVDAFESNEVDAVFLSQAAKLLPGLDRVTAHALNYDFDHPNDDRWNYVICLNVLHHIGRYFDTHVSDLAEAKNLMGPHLQRLLSKAGCVWLQLGFNWQGNTHQPLFSQGTKREMTDFVASLIKPKAYLAAIGIYNAQTKAYEKASYGDWEHPLWQRIDSLGEFGNRPLYLIQSVV